MVLVKSSPGWQRLARTVLFAVVFAAALAYFTDPLGFEYRRNQVESVASDVFSGAENLIASASESPEEDTQLICDNQEVLISKIQKYGSVDKPTEYSNYLSINYDGGGLEHWTAESSGFYYCRKGEKTGENENYMYCSESLGTVLTLQKKQTNANGTIVETGKVEVSNVVLDEKREIMRINCKVLPRE